MKELHFANEYQKFITASKTGKRLTASGKKITDGVLRNYKFTLLLVEQFEQKHEINLRIAILNKASLRTIQQEKNYWQRFYKNFTKFLYSDKKCHDNYVGSIFKNIKTFFNYLQIEKAYPIGQYHKMFKTPKNDFSPVVLTPQQLNFLITNEAFYNSLTYKLQKICDFFIIGCTVGLRVGDLMRLKKSNLVQSNNETHLKIYTQKTGTEISIPLPSYAITILTKYAKGKNGCLLPTISNVNLNKYIKELAEKANWTHALPKNTSKQGKIVEQKKTMAKFLGFATI
jgi:integrase